MGRRSTVYNKITSEESIKNINPDNKQLCEDFLEYLSSIDRSPGTINGYKNDLDIFFCWNLEHNKNKYFIDIKKRELARFQGYALNEWEWSPKRIRRVKSAVSSLSNYIENILQDDDEEFENFRSIIRKIESPANETVREKTVFEMEQLQPLLDKLVEEEKYDQACILSLAINSGRRKAELPRMKVSYFTDDNVIYGSLYKSPEKVKTKGRGTRGKMLTIYTLKSGFKPYLDLWLKYREENNITSEWLVPKKENGVWTNEQLPTSTLDSWAKSYSRFLGVPFYWHSQRHLFVTRLKKENIPDSVIKDLVGWKDISLVSIYDDTEADEGFAKYFDESGIKQVEETKLSDL